MSEIWNQAIESDKKSCINAWKWQYAGNKMSIKIPGFIKAILLLLFPEKAC